jgi:hypothetical protein
VPFRDLLISFLQQITAYSGRYADRDEAGLLRGLSGPSISVADEVINAPEAMMARDRATRGSGLAELESRIAELRDSLRARPPGPNALRTQRTRARLQAAPAPFPLTVPSDVILDVAQTAAPHVKLRGAPALSRLKPFSDQQTRQAAGAFPSVPMPSGACPPQ